MHSKHAFAAGLYGLILIGMASIVPTGQTAVPGYVGSQVCAGCHQQAFDAWQGS